MHNKEIEDISERIIEEQANDTAGRINKILIDFLKVYVDVESIIVSGQSEKVHQSLEGLYLSYEKFCQNILKEQPKRKNTYATYIDCVNDFKNKSLKKIPLFEKLSELRIYKGFEDIPIFLNDQPNEIIMVQIRNKAISKMLYFLKLMREHSDVEGIGELYTYVRMSLNKATMRQGELIERYSGVKRLDNFKLIPMTPYELFLSSDENGEAFYKLETIDRSELKRCVHCNRIIKENENKCKGHNICSYYYDTNEAWYTIEKLEKEEKVFTVSDEYYFYVTLPNLFEELVHDVLKNGLPKDEYTIVLHPRLEKDGDIQVVHKITNKSFLIDCKNYNNPNNLKKYILDDVSTKIKNIINKDSDFIFVVPTQFMGSCILSYMSKNKNVNKFGYIIKNDSNICNYIINSVEQEKSTQLSIGI